MSMSLFVIAILVALAFLLGLFTRSASPRIYRFFARKARTIRQYWLMVFAVLLIAVAGYIIAHYLWNENLVVLDIVLNVWGQIITLLFAIMVGYIAFLQMIEGRFDKLIEVGRERFGKPEYYRARIAFREACSIKPNDFDALSELTELYLVSGDEEFTEALERLEKLAVEPREKITSAYLVATQHLLREDIGTARTAVAELVKRRQIAPQSFSWNFKELRKSERYGNVKNGGKQMLDSLINYLSHNLSPDKVIQFESGDYGLSG
jgi:hypothetical protein